MQDNRTVAELHGVLINKVVPDIFSLLTYLLMPFCHLGFLYSLIKEIELPYGCRNNKCVTVKCSDLVKIYCYNELKSFVNEQSYLYRPTF